MAFAYRKWSNGVQLCGLNYKSHSQLKQEVV